MFKGLSDRMKQLLLEELYRKCNKLDKKLQESFAKKHYVYYELEQMKEELGRIKEILISLED